MKTEEQITQLATLLQNAAAKVGKNWRQIAGELVSQGAGASMVKLGDKIHLLIAKDKNVIGIHATSVGAQTRLATFHQNDGTYITHGTLQP